MSWVGIPYQLISSESGYRAVVGNSDSSKSDADYCGTLDPENGVTGLLDRAGIRESYTDNVEMDGGSHGAFYLSRRSGVMQGMLLPDQYDPLVISAAENKLKLATRALRQDLILRWTPPDNSNPRELRCRVQDGPHITGRRPKQWQVTLVSTDVYALSTAQNSATIAANLSSTTDVVIADPFTDPIGVGSLVGRGIPNPIPEPITSTEVITNQTLVAITNAGNAPTWPWFRITGPVTNPTLLNNTTGLSFSLTYTLNTGEYLDVYPERGRILAGGTADRYSALRFAASDWWQLLAGDNDVRLLADAYSAGAEFTIYWRDAYE